MNILKITSTDQHIKKQNQIMCSLPFPCEYICLEVCILLLSVPKHILTIVCIFKIINLEQPANIQVTFSPKLKSFKKIKN